MPSPETEGYALAAMNDPSGRRGVWFRCSIEDGRRVLEVRGGRDGDDAYAKVVQGLPVHAQSLAGLAEALSRSAGMVEEHLLDEKTREEQEARTTGWAWGPDDGQGRAG